ncbi:hypothetical protein F5X97DRAFT_321016 [Nemania serpens]|nr:hypothetical protein F5X97DRAFT_321016 [Nemania serpens]
MDENGNENENDVFPDPASLEACHLASFNSDGLFNFTNVSSYEDELCYVKSPDSSSSVVPEEASSSIAEPPDEAIDPQSQAENQEPAAKPKRKRENRYKNAPPSVISRRRAQNRASQRAYRERKDQRIKDLELVLRETEKKNEALGQQVEMLKSGNSMLTTELLKASRQISTLRYWLFNMHHQRMAENVPINYCQQGGPQQYQE